MTRSPEVAVPFDGDDVIKDYIAKYSNWGSRGADDELGTLNHVGPEQVVAAAQLVRQGKVMSLTLPCASRHQQGHHFSHAGRLVGPVALHGHPHDSHCSVRPLRQVDEFD